MSTEITDISQQGEALPPRLQDMKPEELQAHLSGKREEPKETSEDAESVKSGAAPEAAETKQEPKGEEERPGHSRFQRRIDKLTAQTKQLEAELAKYKSGTERPRAESPSSEATSKAPRFRDYQNQIGTKFKDWDAAHDAWETARDLFSEQERKAAIAEAVNAEREAIRTREAQEQQAKDIEKNAKKFADRQAEYRKTLKKDNFNEAFLEVKDALDDAIAVDSGYAQISQILIESEVGPEMVHYLGENPKELDALLSMPLARALRELGRLEASDKIKAPTPKTHTASRKITDSVKGGNVTHDALEEAVQKNSMKDYLKARGVEVKW